MVPLARGISDIFSVAALIALSIDHGAFCHNSEEIAYLENQSRVLKPDLYGWVSDGEFDLKRNGYRRCAYVYNAEQYL